MCPGEIQPRVNDERVKALDGRVIEETIVKTSCAVCAAKEQSLRVFVCLRRVTARAALNPIPCVDLDRVRTVAEDELCRSGPLPRETEAAWIGINAIRLAEEIARFITTESVGIVVRA